MKNSDNLNNFGNNYEGKEKHESNQFISIITTQEVADFLRIHRSTVTRMAKSGEIKSYKVGNRRLFKYNDVLRFFDNQVDLQCISEKEV
jgi:excisionase family DNA binding protein